MLLFGLDSIRLNIFIMIFFNLLRSIWSSKLNGLFN